MYLHHAGYWERDELDVVPALQELWVPWRRSKPHGMCHNVTACRTQWGRMSVYLDDSGKTPKEVM